MSSPSRVACKRCIFSRILSESRGHSSKQDDGRLICFRDHKPARARTIGKVRGLEVDTKLIGIDYRPSNGGLYGLGDKGGVYKVTESNGRVALQGRVSVALSGTSFGIDFDPVADRLRIVSDTGQNLSVNPDSGEADRAAVLRAELAAGGP